ncbi:hypothetical protein SASPL_118895 [Salvia splendens]|uniref:Uncharacterized protein n=1 Tax=Salvia splendens TaxID=180675 RepID=A0A8X8ZXN4_SALSN|nr:hypothetical protein SASPL_118895 [Salvia splendens]
MIRHKRPGAALRVGALLPEALHLSRIVDLVELEDGELHLLVLVLDLLRLGVGLVFMLGLAIILQSHHAISPQSVSTSKKQFQVPIKFWKKRDCQDEERRAAAARTNPDSSNGVTSASSSSRWRTTARNGRIPTDSETDNGDEKITLATDHVKTARKLILAAR